MVLPVPVAPAIRPWRFALYGGSFLPLIERKGVLLMVTYSDLIQIGILIVGIIGLFLMVKNQK